MFINQNVVATVFKLINFTMLIGIGFFLFKKYIKADILFSMSQEEAVHQDLLSQQLNLEQQQSDLNILLKQETIQCQDFKSKIDEWKKTMLIEEDKHKKEYAQLFIIIKKQHAEIALQKENQRIHNDILDSIVVPLEKSLSHHFKNPPENNHYLNAIIHFMNERIS